jgi:endonuclease III related protein
MAKSKKIILEKIYRRLYEEFGPQHWWPGQTKFEVIIGAILTQNTNWDNVEKALRNLKRNQLLSPYSLRNVSVTKLASLIKPAGYFNVKAKRLKNFIVFLFDEYKGSLKKMEKEELAQLRQKLLRVNGIGPETADSILLYAFHKPVFVVDAYTKRVLYRHNIVDKDADYHSIQNIFMYDLSHDVKLFNEYHALIVRLGKQYCKTNPVCEQCPLNNYHYSLVYKCRHCHRALQGKQGRVVFENGYLCQDCYAKGAFN